MGRKGTEPVTIDGIMFDAMISSTETLSSQIPQYPVETGYSVSDGIINDPVELKMELYVSATPITYMDEHDIGFDEGYDYVKEVIEQLRQLYEDRQLVKIVTPDYEYTNMGITSIEIKDSTSLWNGKEISISAQKVYYTTLKSADIPADILLYGQTASSAGTASTSTTSSKAENSTAGGVLSSTSSSSSSSTSTSLDISGLGIMAYNLFDIESSSVKTQKAQVKANNKTTLAMGGGER